MTVEANRAQAQGQEGDEHDPRPPTACFIHWATEGLSCFARDEIRMDLNNLAPTRTRIAAIFGLIGSEGEIVSFTIRERNSGNIVTTLSSAEFPLEPGAHYLLSVEGDNVASSLSYTRVPIKKIFGLLGTGSTSHTSGPLSRLSEVFYTGVFNDHEHAEFRALFTAKATLPTAIDNQSRWFTEMWGGPPAYSEKHGAQTLLPRMIGKHPKHVMSFRNARIWLLHMNKAMSAVRREFGLGDDAVHSMRSYFAHFFAFFPLSATELDLLVGVCFGRECDGVAGKSFSDYSWSLLKTKLPSSLLFGLALAIPLAAAAALTMKTRKSRM